MRRPAIVEAREGLVPARPEADNHLLELPDGEHVVEEVEGRSGGDEASPKLAREVAPIQEAEDRPTRLLERAEVRPQVAQVGGLVVGGRLRGRRCPRQRVGHGTLRVGSL
ncbi:MAG: hypothetical protein C4343_00830 [Chloroflexota bacterium]